MIFVDAVFAALSRSATEAFAFGFLEGSEHVACVAESFVGTNLKRLAYHSDQIGMCFSAKVGITAGRPLVGPFRKGAGQDSVAEQTHGKDIRSRTGTAHGLFGGHVAHGSGAGCDDGSNDGALCDLGDSKVGQLEATIG